MSDLWSTPLCYVGAERPHGSVPNCNSRVVRAFAHSWKCLLNKPSNKLEGVEMKRSSAFLPLILLSVLLPPTSCPQQPKINFTQLERVALDELKETNTPGAALAIVSGDRLVFAKGFGVTSIETGDPVTPDTLFRIGSVTKMFTAAVLVSLAEEGRIKSDEPIGKYVKGLNPKLSLVTAHQLMSHMAGMKEGTTTDLGPPDQP